jgi:tRNA nucleotidyltransferase (CCA-adding enzyme)
MKAYLNKLPKDIRNLIYLARNVAAKKRTHAYLVGGFVRDLILGVPNFDLDIVVEADAFAFASELARRLCARLKTHPHFGTATIATPDKIKIDIATARSERYPSPASLPAVSPGRIQEDLARRDFTINALAIDLLPGNFGRLVDYYHGGRDLRSKVIRVLHDLSFIDDPTRIIRAVRFEQRFKFRIEPHTLKLLKDAKKLGMLKRVSPHRLRSEIILILKEPRAYNCILRLNRLVGFDFIHPRIRLNKADFKFLRKIKTEVEWYEKNFPKRRALDVWVMYFTVLLGNVDKRQINQFCKRFGLRKGDTKRIISYYKFCPSKVSSLGKNILPSQIYRILEPLSFEVILLIKAKHKNRLLNLHIERFFKYYNEARPYISGKDLTKLGLKPSPEYKKILNRLFHLQLNQQISSRQEALDRIAHRRSQGKI